MIIDCTLNSLVIGGFPEFIPDFGTKKADGESVTAREANRNALLPFASMRPKEVAEDSSTSEIQANTCFNVTVGGVTLTLGNGAYNGCRVAVVNNASAAVTVDSTGLQIQIPPASVTHLEFVGGHWKVDSALSYAESAAEETQKTIRRRIQTGIARIANRGVISGCAITKSTGAVRNISLSAGTFFINGLEVFCPALANTSLVPPNNETVAQVCYAYIFLGSDGKTVQFACTPFGGSVPEGGLALYRFTVPANNTEVNDPYLSSVTMTDVRRMESGFPVFFNSVAYASVALPYDMLDSDYEVVFDIIDFKGGSSQRSAVYAGDKAANGFKLYAEGTLDAVTVRWSAIKMSL
jgi:hypothetical protein